jgi:putative transcriptional regulator
MKSRIGELIDARGFKRKYIAEKLGVTQKQLSNWCTNRNYPTVPKLFKLAEILNCTVDELYEREKDEDKNTE